MITLTPSCSIDRNKCHKHRSKACICISVHHRCLKSCHSRLKGMDRSLFQPGHTTKLRQSYCKSTSPQVTRSYGIIFFKAKSMCRTRRLRGIYLLISGYAGGWLSNFHSCCLLIRAVGNDHVCDTTERASQRLFSSYKGGFPCITEVGRNPLIP